MYGHDMCMTAHTHINRIMEHSTSQTKKKSHKICESYLKDPGRDKSIGLEKQTSDLITTGGTQKQILE